MNTKKGICGKIISIFTVFSLFFSNICWSVEGMGIGIGRIPEYMTGYNMSARIEIMSFSDLENVMISHINAAPWEQFRSVFMEAGAYESGARMVFDLIHSDVKLGLKSGDRFVYFGGPVERLDDLSILPGYGSMVSRMKGNIGRLIETSKEGLEAAPVSSGEGIRFREASDVIKYADKETFVRYLSKAGIRRAPARLAYSIARSDISVTFIEKDKPSGRGESGKNIFGSVNFPGGRKISEKLETNGEGKKKKNGSADPKLSDEEKKTVRYINGAGWDEFRQLCLDAGIDMKSAKTMHNMINNSVRISCGKGKDTVTVGGPIKSVKDLEKYPDFIRILEKVKEKIDEEKQVREVPAPAEKDSREEISIIAGKEDAIDSMDGQENKGGIVEFMNNAGWEEFKNIMEKAGIDQDSIRMVYLLMRSNIKVGVNTRGGYEYIAGAVKNREELMKVPVVRDIIGKVSKYVEKEGDPGDLDAGAIIEDITADYLNKAEMAEFKGIMKKAGIKDEEAEMIFDLIHGGTLFGWNTGKELKFLGGPLRRLTDLLILPVFRKKEIDDLRINIIKNLNRETDIGLEMLDRIKYGLTGIESIRADNAAGYSPDSKELRIDPRSFANIVELLGSSPQTGVQVVAILAALEAAKTRATKEEMREYVSKMVVERYGKTEALGIMVWFDLFNSGYMHDSRIIMNLVTYQAVREYIKEEMKAFDEFQRGKVKEKAYAIAEEYLGRMRVIRPVSGAGYIMVEDKNRKKDGIGRLVDIAKRLSCAMDNIAFMPFLSGVIPDHRACYGIRSWVLGMDKSLTRIIIEQMGSLTGGMGGIIQKIGEVDVPNLTEMLLSST